MIVFTNATGEKIRAGFTENFPETELVMTLEGEWKVDSLNKSIGPVESVAMKPLQDWTRYDQHAVTNILFLNFQTWHTGSSAR